MLNISDGFECAGAYPNCDDLIGVLTRSEASICLMDIEMPGISGIEATRVIKSKLPHVHVLIQTVFSNDDSIFQAICAGASGYILKTTSPELYIEALKDVQSGGAPMTPSIAKRVLQLFKVNLQPASDKTYQLTEKEKQVLQQLTLGKSYKMIAGELQISSETIKTHIKNIYIKLHVHSGPEAVAKAIQERLV